MQLQAQLDSLVVQHRESFATLRRDLEKAIPAVARMWESWFEDPTEIHGQAFCTCVRQVLLAVGMDRAPVEGESLTTGSGSGMPVVVSDANGSDINVRKVPSKVLSDGRIRVVHMPPAPARPANVAPAVSPVLDDGMDPPVLPTPEVKDPEKKPLWDLYVLWQPTADGHSLADAWLAAVVDIDNASRVRVLGVAELPPVTASPRMRTSKRGHPVDDFDSQAAQADGDPGTTPA